MAVDEHSSYLRCSYEVTICMFPSDPPHLSFHVFWPGERAQWEARRRQRDSPRTSSRPHWGNCLFFCVIIACFSAFFLSIGSSSYLSPDAQIVAATPITFSLQEKTALEAKLANVMSAIAGLQSIAPGLKWQDKKEKKTWRRREGNKSMDRPAISGELWWLWLDIDCLFNCLLRWRKNKNTIAISKSKLCQCILVRAIWVILVLPSRHTLSVVPFQDERDFGCIQPRLRPYNNIGVA